MIGVPVFIEVVTGVDHANAEVCRKIMAALFKEKVAPLPFASTAQEVAGVLDALKARGMVPAVFVINTFWAEDLLSQIDPLMGQTQVVYLRRSIFSGPLLKAAAADAASAEAGSLTTTTTVLDKMTPRPCVHWTYGSQTAGEVAAAGAKALLRFLREGDWSVLEQFAQTQTYEMLKSRDQRAPRHTSLESAVIVPTKDERDDFDERSPRHTSIGKAAPPAASGHAPVATASAAPAVKAESASPRPAAQPAPPAAGKAKSSGAAPAVQTASPTISGILGQLSLGTMLKMLELEKRSGELLVSYQELSARLLLNNGQVVEASVNGQAVPPGAESGRGALQLVLSWNDGRFDFFPQAAGAAGQASGSGQDKK